MNFTAGALSGASAVFQLGVRHVTFGRMTADQLQRIRAGDISAFEEVFRELHGPLSEVVDSYVQSQAIAEEIVQDLFFAVWMKRSSIVALSLRAYLFRAARNRALHHQRHESVVRRVARLLPFRPEVSGVATAASATDSALYGEEQQATLRAAVQQLPPRSRLALTLKLDHGFADREIAESMGISVKGVEKLLGIAKRRLRELLLERDDMLPHIEF